MASFLDELKKKASNSFGSLPTPELGISEFFGGNPTSVAVKNQGTYQSRNPSVLGAATAPSAPYNLPAIPEGFGSGGSGGGSGVSGGINNGGVESGLKGLADTSKQSRIASIKGRLGLIRDQVNRGVDTARSVRDELLNNIATTYGGLRTSAQQKVGTALENLGQERSGVYDTYGTAKGETRRALESAMLRNRNIARATGRLNSSFYDDRQAEANEAGSRGISGLAREEAGKVAGIGTRETETKNWGEQTLLGIDQEESGLKSQADREYSQRVQDAMDMERAFGIDSEDELNQAEVEYQSKLGSIQQYVENKGMRIAEILATAQGTGQNINSFNAYTPELQTLLTNNSELTDADQLQIPQFSSVNGNGGNSYANINQNQSASALEDLYKRLGLRFA